MKIDNHLKTIQEPARSIPIRAEVDVLVCGGGAAGCTAALAAARTGAKVALVENMPFLGGVNTMAQVNGIGGWQYELDSTPLINGLPMEIIRRLAEMEGANPSLIGKLARPKDGPPDYTDGGLGCFWVNVNPEYMKILYDRMMAEAGVEVLLCSTTVFPIVENETFLGVFVESKSGREAILADVVIDCTGDGDIAARAGAQWQIGRPEDGACQPMTQMFTLGKCHPPRLWYGKESTDPEPDPLLRNRLRGAIELARRHGEFVKNPNDILCSATALNPIADDIRSINFTRIQHLQAIDASQLSEALAEGREQVFEALAFLRKRVPGCEEAFLLQMAPMIGIRESRRILGEHILSKEEILTGKDFHDTIARGIYLLDIHNPSDYGKPSTLTLLKQPYSIPYRSLLPLGLNNVLVAGRCISGDHFALASYRVQSHAMAIGEAAGCAAGLSALSGVAPKHLNIKLLQHTLVKNGANIGPGASCNSSLRSRASAAV